MNGGGPLHREATRPLLKVFQAVVRLPLEVLYLGEARKVCRTVGASQENGAVAIFVSVISHD